MNVYDNTILANGYGEVRSVAEAKAVAENAKHFSEPDAVVASLVMINEALKESEKVIFQLFARSKEFDKQMLVMRNELKRKREKKKR